MSKKIWSAALNGVDAKIITVEADAGGGDFGQISIVGLPDAAVSESKDRVKSALRNCGLPFPRRKITVNLAPADLRKRGPAYDLPIAISILALNNEFKADFTQMLFIGELSLSGEVRRVNGVLSIAMAANNSGIKQLFVPYDNAGEAALIRGLNIFPVTSLKETILHLKKIALIREYTELNISAEESEPILDFNEIKGQEKAKRALEIAAAGGHNILFCGPPGSGKTMLARAMPSILPELSLLEKIEITKIYSAAGELKNMDLISRRPFRSPHHNSSINSLIGGGAWPRPGEISLAHRGVLFLDEFPEFPRPLLESLRQPLEEGLIHINRAAAHLYFPARFTLLAAMNPCPCGYSGSRDKDCNCSERQISSYRRRLSGPILDRIDMHIWINRVPWKELSGGYIGDNSLTIKDRVKDARTIQAQRFEGLKFLTNTEITGRLIDKFCHLDKETESLLEKAGENMRLSARSILKMIKLSRTIADLDHEPEILAKHVAEALQYRPKLN